MISGPSTKRGKALHVDMVSQMSCGALGDVVVRRMGVGKDKGKNEESVQNGSKVWAAGGSIDLLP